MPKYIVQGEEGADVDIVGTIFKSGDAVELREDVAAPLLEAGTIVPAEAADEAATVAEQAPSEEPVAEAPSEQAAPEAEAEGESSAPDEAPAPEGQEGTQPV